MAKGSGMPGKCKRGLFSRLLLLLLLLVFVLIRLFFYTRLLNDYKISASAVLVEETGDDRTKNEYKINASAVLVEETGNDKTKKPMARICWTGVANDWPIEALLEELDTRNRNNTGNSIVSWVINPLIQAGYDVRVFILADKPSRDAFEIYREPYSFSQPATYKWSMYTSGNLDQRSRQLYAAALYKRSLAEKHRNNWDYSAELQNRTENAIIGLQQFAKQLDLHLGASGSPNVNLGLQDGLGNPPVPMDYVKAMANRDAMHIDLAWSKDPSFNDTKHYRQLNYRTFGQVVWRVVNDVRLLHRLSLCGEWLQKELHQSNSRSSGSSDRTNLVLRMGDDLQLDKPIPIDAIQAMKPRQFLAIPGRTARGHTTDQLEVMVHQSAASAKDTTTTDNWLLDSFSQPYRGFYQLSIFDYSTYTNEDGSVDNITDTIISTNNGTRGIQSMADYLRMVYQSQNIEILATYDTSVELRNQSFENATKLEDLTIPDGWNTYTAENTTNSNPVNYPMDDSQFFHSEDSSAVVDIAPGNKKTALICITGQMGRLELQNKFETLIQPMYQQGGYDSIDLTFVLSPGKPVFHASGHQLILERAGFVSFTNKSSILQFFENKHGFTSKSSFLQFFKKKHGGTMPSYLRNVKVRLYEPHPNLPINPQYLFQKGEQVFWGSRNIVRLKEKDFYERLDITVYANTKMISAYPLCYTEEDAQTHRYDLYVRLREDVGFKEVASPELYDEIAIPEGSYMTHGDNNGGGINDRMAFVRGHRAALCYFHFPFVNFYNGRAIHIAAVNTESYFFRSFATMRCMKHLVLGGNILNPGKLVAGNFVA